VPATTNTSKRRYTQYMDEVKTMVTDPVCGMDVDGSRSDWRADYEGKVYYFCSESCMNAFISNPTQHLRRIQRPAHLHDHGLMGGCCGMGMGRGWMRYLYIGLMLLYLISVLTR
jgi:YHS domain-containing protein